MQSRLERATTILSGLVVGLDMSPAKNIGSIKELVGDDPEKIAEHMFIINAAEIRGLCKHALRLADTLADEAERFPELTVPDPVVELAKLKK